MINITHSVGESLRISLGFSLVYLFGTVGFILAFIAFLKLLVWILTRRVCAHCCLAAHDFCNMCKRCSLCCNCERFNHEVTDRKD